MPIDYNHLMKWPFQSIERDYTAKDTMLYALGLNIGHDPLDPQQLRFVYEQNLSALPTLATVLGYPGFWLRTPGTGVDWTQLLHGEQGITIHRPLQPAGSIIARTKVTEIIDKGPGRGALVFQHREIRDRNTNDLLCEVRMTSVCRADGGFGGPSGPVPAPHPIPQREPDIIFSWPTAPQQALIYRLSGDDNPLHADPAIAKGAGFPQPILHGLSTYGIVGYAAVAGLCGSDPARLRRLDARFSAPVLPGDLLTIHIWREKPGVGSVRVLVANRGDIVAINNGLVEYEASPSD